MTETPSAGNLADELRTLVEDAEALLRSGLASGGAELQGRAEDTLADLKARLGNLEQQLNQRARDVDSYVRDNPWQVVGIAAVVGIVLGVMMTRSSSD